MEEDKRLELSLAPPGDTNSNSNKRVEIPGAASVGWPPVGTYRRNLTGKNLGKPPSDAGRRTQKKEEVMKQGKHKKELFVKINMEGIPIGRKVNLSACTCYEQLSSAIRALFSTLLLAQVGSSLDDDIENKVGEQKESKGGLGGSGEYTLVYEDNEGDRILVGDVPWEMFVSTVRRLHVLKISERPNARK